MEDAKPTRGNRYMTPDGGTDWKRYGEDLSREVARIVEAKLEIHPEVDIANRTVAGNPVGLGMAVRIAMANSPLR